MIRRRGVPLQASSAHEALPVDGVSRLPLVEEEAWPTAPAILNEESGMTVNRFLRDIRNADLLSEGGLLSRFGLMLSGPPGTGKTLLAGHISAQLKRRFFIMRLDSLISSRLGETAKNIRQVFDYVPTKGAVLLLDEMDAIAKVRDDRHELGELKRVVNTVIQGLDSLDDRAVVIAATNHPHLLDAAIWRRFPYHCEVGLPTETTRAELWNHYLYQGDKEFRHNAMALSVLSDCFSGADIENVALATRRLAVLNGVDLPEPQLLWALVQSAPPNFGFPTLDKLSANQKTEIVRRVTQTQGVTKSALARMLRTSRQMIHRYLAEQENV